MGNIIEKRFPLHKIKQIGCLTVRTAELHATSQSWSLCSIEPELSEPPTGKPTSLSQEGHHHIEPMGDMSKRFPHTKWSWTGSWQPWTLELTPHPAEPRTSFQAVRTRKLCLKWYVEVTKVLQSSLLAAGSSALRAMAKNYPQLPSPSERTYKPLVPWLLAYKLAC